MMSEEDLKKNEEKQQQQQPLKKKNWTWSDEHGREEFEVILGYDYFTEQGLKKIATDLQYDSVEEMKKIESRDSSSFMKDAFAIVFRTRDVFKSCKQCNCTFPFNEGEGEEEDEDVCDCKPLCSLCHCSKCSKRFKGKACKDCFGDIDGDDDKKSRKRKRDEVEDGDEDRHESKKVAAAAAAAVCCHFCSKVFGEEDIQGSSVHDCYPAVKNDEGHHSFSCGVCFDKHVRPLRDQILSELMNQ
jgi:hypothetical protein